MELFYKNQLKSQSHTTNNHKRENQQALKIEKMEFQNKTHVKTIFNLLSQSVLRK